MPVVTIGQVWRDNDKRTSYFRDMQVISIDGDKATVRNVRTGKLSKIRLNRFKPNSTGYKLIRE